jgi:hypothetical protein
LVGSGKFGLAPCALALERHFGWIDLLIFEEIDSYKIIYSGFRLGSNHAPM